MPDFFTWPGMVAWEKKFKTSFKVFKFKPEVVEPPVKMADDSPSAARRVRCQSRPGFDISFTC